MGYKIAVIIVIFQLIAGLVVNILLLQNGKQYSIRNCYGGFRRFVLYLWCLLPTSVPLPLPSLPLSPFPLPLFLSFCESVYQSISECQTAHCQGSGEAGRGKEQNSTLIYLFVLVSTLPLLFIYKLEYSPFRPVMKVGWVRSSWKSNQSSICSLVTCTLLRNTP